MGGPKDRIIQERESTNGLRNRTINTDSTYERSRPTKGFEQIGKNLSSVRKF